MSQYIVITKTVFKDLALLKEALADIGVCAEHVEQHQKGVRLEGYEGNLRSQKANLVIRRKNVGRGSNDIGFALQADGTYSLLISSYDAHTYLGNKMLGADRGGTGELTQHYAKRAILKALKYQKGHVLKSCKEKDGKIQIKIAVN